MTQEEKELYIKTIKEKSVVYAEGRLGDPKTFASKEDYENARFAVAQTFLAGANAAGKLFFDMLHKNMMEADIIKKWDENKENLRKWYAVHTIGDVKTYEKIVRIICRVILGLREAKPGGKSFSHTPESGEYYLTEISYQQYQGYSVFVIYTPYNIYDLDSFLITNNEYGSCSGCDTLKGILDDECDKRKNELLSKEQVKELMTLSLHLVQKMRRLKDEVNDDDDD